MASIMSLEKIEIIRNQEFMLSEVMLRFLKKMIILGPKTAILGPQFCRILLLGPQFWWSGGAQAPLDPPLLIQSDLLNSNSLNSSFLLNLLGKFENFETITIDTNVKSTFN